VIKKEKEHRDRSSISSGCRGPFEQTFGVDGNDILTVSYAGRDAEIAVDVANMNANQPDEDVDISELQGLDDDPESCGPCEFNSARHGCRFRDRHGGCEISDIGDDR
jgi:hypothetical protein